MVSEEEIPEHWELKELSEVLSRIKGGSSADQHDEPRGYPVSRIETIADAHIDPDAVKYTEISDKEYEKHVMKEGDILFSNINSPAHIGKTAIYRGEPEDLIHGMNLILLRADENRMSAKFLNRLLKFLKKKGIFEDMCKQAVNQASLAQKDIKPIQVPVPPLEEQEIIVEKLDEIFSSIEEIQVAQEKVKDLEDELKVSITTSELEKYDNTEKIEDVISRIKGGSSADQHDEPEGYPVSRIETIADAKIDPEAVKYVDIGDKEYEKHLMQKGDILFSNINSPPHVGKTAIYEGEPENLIHGMNLVLIRADEEKILPNFLELALTHEKNKGTFRNMCKQAVNQASLAQRDIKPIEITVPPLKDQEEIMQKISSVREKIKETYKSHTESQGITEDIPKSVLSEAFKGNLVDYQAENKPKDSKSSLKGENDSGSEFDGEGQQDLEKF